MQEQLVTIEFNGSQQDRNNLFKIVWKYLRLKFISQTYFENISEVFVLRDMKNGVSIHR